MNNFIVILPLSIFYLSIGIWEGVVASNHQPDDATFSNDQKMAYAFTVIKCVLNILTAINLLFIDFNKKDKDKNNNYFSITPFSLKNGTLNSEKNIIAPFQA